LPAEVAQQTSSNSKGCDKIPCEEEQGIIFGDQGKTKTGERMSG